MDVSLVGEAGFGGRSHRPAANQGSGIQRKGALPIMPRGKSQQAELLRPSAVAGSSPAPLAPIAGEQQ